MVHPSYDHCQTDLLLALYNRSTRPLTFLVPLGVKSLLVSTGIDANRVVELDWWDSSAFPIGAGEVTFTCTPTQHNSGRGLHDQGATLWASWAVKQVWRESPSTETEEGTQETGKVERERVANIWHAGDTGYQSAPGPCPVFKGLSPDFNLISQTYTYCNRNWREAWPLRPHSHPHLARCLALLPLAPRLFSRPRARCAPAPSRPPRLARRRPEYT